MVLSGGAALAIPYPRYSGQWKQEQSPSVELTEYVEYLTSISALSPVIHFSKLQQDVALGWQFESTIPIGSGLGSSAAVVAAILDRYQQKTAADLDLDEIQSIFKQMEGYMHGESSGMDPLPIYYNQPIIVQSDGNKQRCLELSVIESWDLEVIDSGIHREALPWITHFKNKWSTDENFAREMTTLSELNNQIVHGIIQGDNQDLPKLLKEYSYCQFEHMSDWIPPSIQSIWLESFSQSNEIIKLLGAGGGGCFLRIRF